MKAHRVYRLCHPCFLMMPPPPRSTLFPYTTLFRSVFPVLADGQIEGVVGDDQRVGRCPRGGRENRDLGPDEVAFPRPPRGHRDRKSTRLNSSHPSISYAVFCLKKKNQLTEMEKY